MNLALTVLTGRQVSSSNARTAGSATHPVLQVCDERDICHLRTFAGVPVVFVSCIHSHGHIPM
jgi:hypothetical protein